MYKEVYKKIKKYNNIVIARHIGVDPDALCSQLALRDSIKLSFPDKKVIAIGKGSQRFINIGSLDKMEQLENALLIVCDTPDIKRIDSANPSDYSDVIKIDHHPFMDDFGGIEIIDSNKSSACEMIMELIKKTPLKCNKEVAELLYIGLVSDSNRFLFDNTTEKTFRLVADFLGKYHFKLSEQYQKLYLRPISEVRLEGYISTNMHLTENGLAYIVIDDDTLNNLGVDTASPGNMINNFNYIKEVLVWATITEDKKNNQYRISIRSRGPDIHKVVEKHGGGGHSMASGARVKELDAAMSLMRDLDSLLIEYNKKEVIQ